MGWYDAVRHSTLRLLASLSPEELAWQPDPSRNSAQWIFAHLAATEDLRIHWRVHGVHLLDRAFLRAYRSGASLEASQGLRLAGDELYALLARMKRKTGRFLKRVLDGREHTASPSLISELEKLIFHEVQHQGQIQYLRKLREGKPSGKESRIPARREPAPSREMEGRARPRRVSNPTGTQGHS